MLRYVVLSDFSYLKRRFEVDELESLTRGSLLKAVPYTADNRFHITVAKLEFYRYNDAYGHYELVKTIEALKED